jgi:outer membrane autotransporter protein
VNSYREQGAGMFDFKYNSQNVRSLRSMLGTRINYSWNWTNVVFKPEINLGWQWEFFDKNRHIGVSGGGFGTNLLLPQPGRNVALAGIDFLVTLFDKYGIEASYDFEWNKLYVDHFFYVGCNFKF